MRAPPLVSWLLLTALVSCSRGTPAPAPATTPPASASAPASAASPPTARATDHFITAKGDLTVTPLEHASVLFGWHGEAIYADPTVAALADPALPKADVIFITDIHPDHLDLPALDRLRKPETVIVGPQAVADKIRVDVVLHNGDTHPVADLVATAVPMYNLVRGPAAGKLYHDKGRGDGYVLDFAGTRVYLSGDTECTPEMKALQNIDVAFVCMNLPYTMPPAEAAQCVAAFKPRVLFPYHYRGSSLAELDAPLQGSGVEIRKRAWYPADK